MRSYVITVTTEEPLLIGDRHGDGSGAMGSQTWIPGQTVRGAMAAYWQHGVSESWFERAIAKGEMSFSPLFPVASKPETGGYWGPIPVTAASCKRFAGFGTQNNGHGVHDRLLEHEFWGAGAQGANLSNRSVTQHACMECGSKLGKFRGFLHKQKKGDTRRIDPSGRLITRTAVNDHIDSVADGQLYSLKPINEENLFAGLIHLPDDLDDGNLLGVARLRLGKARSRGLGRVSVAIDALGHPLGGTLENRVSAFQRLLKEHQITVPVGETWVTLDLWSPLLLRDPWMRDRLHMEPADFHPHGSNLAWQVENLALEAVWTGGWHGFLNLPRSHRQALAPGGVIGLKIRGDRAEVMAALNSIQTNGLGEAWADGFGRVLCCHPFHQHFIIKEATHACN